MRVEVSDYGATDERGVRTGLMPVELLGNFWPSIEQMLDKVPHTWDSLTKGGIFADIAEQRSQVWLVADGELIKFVCFTRIAVHQAYTILEVFWAAGEGMLDKAGPTLDAALEQFARSHKCREIMVIGRGGWEKLLQSWGYKKRSVILTRLVAPVGRTN